MNTITKEITTTDGQSLAGLLIISEARPKDLIANPSHLDGIRNAIEVTSSFVSVLTDEGFKEAKSRAADIRKFIKIWNEHRIAAVKEANAETNKWDGEAKLLLKQLGEIPERDLKAFEERQQEKLDTIQRLAYDLLKVCRVEIGVKPEFMSGVDFSPIMKLSGSLTDTGKLTAKAAGFVKTLANNDLSAQNKVESRRMLIEVRCLRDEIRPALTEAHFGAVFYADEAEFNAKLESLVAIEITRRAEMEARIIKQQEAENQRKIDAALREQQAEANRLAKAKADQEAAELAEQRQKDFDRQAQLNHERANAIAEKELLARRAEGEFVAAMGTKQAYEQARVTAQQVDNEIAAKRKREDDIKNPPVESTIKCTETRPNKRVCRFTVDFEVTVPERISNTSVEEHFMSKLPDYLKKLMVDINFQGGGLYE